MVSDRERRRELQNEADGLSDEEVRAHPELTLHEKSGKMDLDRYAKEKRAEETGGILYRTRRRHVRALVALGEEVYGDEPRLNVQLPLGAPIPPATDVVLTCTEGGNEGWFTRLLLIDRSKGAPGGRYRRPVVREAWCAKHLSQPEVKQPIEDRIWDLGSPRKARKEWEWWHEEGAYETEAAATCKSLSGRQSTDRVRAKSSAYEWTQATRQKAEEAWMALGWPIARELMDMPKQVVTPRSRRIAGLV
jgi:hypothetical protein